MHEVFVEHACWGPSLGKRLGRQRSSVLAAYLMVRLLLMLIRLEKLLKAPARGWGDGCLNLLRLSYFVSAEYGWTQLLVGIRLGHPRPRIHKAAGTWLPPEAGAHDYKFSH